MKVKRLKEINDYIKEKGSCSYEELCAHFDISLSTIRRDIKILEDEHQIEKSSGGVSSIGEDKTPAQFPFEEIKDHIARRAAELVEDNDIIILGSGSTVAHMVPHLKNKKNITVITNNLAVLEASVNMPFRVICIGGNLDRRTMSFVGTQTAQHVKGLNANKAFLSGNGITLNGVTNVADLEAVVKKEIMRISSETIYLMDRSKFDKMSLYTICPIEDMDVIVTDGKLADDYMEAFSASGVKVEIA